MTINPNPFLALVLSIFRPIFHRTRFFRDFNFLVRTYIYSVNLLHVVSLVLNALEGRLAIATIWNLEKFKLFKIILFRIKQKT
jgi:hypothetical protein